MAQAFGVHAHGQRLNLAHIAFGVLAARQRRAPLRVGAIVRIAIGIGANGQQLAHGIGAFGARRLGHHRRFARMLLWLQRRRRLLLVMVVLLLVLLLLVCAYRHIGHGGRPLGRMGSARPLLAHHSLETGAVDAHRRRLEDVLVLFALGRRGRFGGGGGDGVRRLHWGDGRRIGHGCREWGHSHFAGRVPEPPSVAAAALVPM